MEELLQAYLNQRMREARPSYTVSPPAIMRMEDALERLTAQLGGPVGVVGEQEVLDGVPPAVLAAAQVRGRRGVDAGMVGGLGGLPLAPGHRAHAHGHQGYAVCSRPRWADARRAR